eukprot:m.427894 g.427894  ORF g.427894 m.427894 type:complete len:354 (-) comp21366_c0_seq9:225-1286(-)
MPKFPPLPQLLESSTNMPSVSGSTATNGRLNLDGFPMRGPPGAAPPTAPAHATHSARDFGTILAAAEGMTPQALQQLQQQHLQPTTAGISFPFGVPGTSASALPLSGFPLGALLGSGGKPLTPSDSPFAQRTVQHAAESTASIARGGRDSPAPATSGFPLRGPAPRGTRKGRGKAAMKRSRAAASTTINPEHLGAWSGGGALGAGPFGDGSATRHMMMPLHGNASGALGHAMGDGSMALYYQMHMMPPAGAPVGSNSAPLQPPPASKRTTSAASRDPAIDPKLKLKREKNKEAAQKCRAKKRDLIASLETQCAAMQGDNDTLRREIDEMQARLASSSESAPSPPEPAADAAVS